METQEHKFGIGIFDGASIDILELDFSFLNLKSLKLGTPEFQAYLDEFNDEIGSQTLYTHFQNDSSSGYRPYLYAFCPIDISKPVKQEVFDDIETIMLIMFPSEVQLVGLVFHTLRESGRYLEEGAYYWDYVSHWYLSEERDAELLKLDVRKIEQINLFIRSYFDKKDSLKDFQVAIESYIEAFSQKSPKMAYINFSIALEALVGAESELTYRISRTCAVINASSKSEGRVILKNAKSFYTLRSKIVHGGDKLNYLKEYFFNLRALVSRTLIEILTLNIHDRQTLGNFVNENGFGDKVNYVDDYKKQDFNQRIIDLMLMAVPTYKSSKS
jgi:hypothetical protein